jgi:hypothetical protein
MDVRVTNRMMLLLIYSGKLDETHYAKLWHREERVMVLMHGYGLGLGCYFGQCTSW